jgi:hypothetical protein
MWGLGFAGVGVAFHDVETWKIDESEAAELSTRLAAAADSFQKDRTSKLVLWIKKHEAELYFLVGLLVLVLPRLYFTFITRPKAKVPHGNLPQTGAAPLGPRLVTDADASPGGVSSSAPSPTAPPVTDVPFETVAVAGGADEEPAGNGFAGALDIGRAPTGFKARSFTRADFREIDSGAE